VNRTSPGRRRLGPRRGGEHAEANDERWMASYMDMVTVLMCTFIVLFSMSSIDANKFAELKNSLQTGFGVVKTQKVDTATGVIVPPKDVDDPKATKPAPIALARIELDHLKDLEAKIDARLSAKGLKKDVSFTIDQRGLTVGLVGSQTFFDTNLATLTPVAKRVIRTIGPVLRTVDNRLSMEGHADERPPAPPYPTNWELAAARAVSVLRELNTGAHIPGDRMDAVSYGDTKATASSRSAAALANDRRVDIVVLSDQSEDVRSLIPKVLHEEERG